MTEKSMLWTTGSTGDGASPYTQAETIRMFRQWLVGDETDEGVFKNYANELEVTGTASPVAVNTGAGCVYGFTYWNTASVNVSVPTPSGDTRIDRIVLEADWTAQTVRIERVAGSEGSGTPPSLTQTDGTTWQISLAQASITTGGVITVTDERVFLHPNIEVETAMLEDDAVTAAKIAADSIDDTHAGNRIPQLYRRQGGSATIWSLTGSTDYTPTTVRMQCGVASWTGSAASSGAVTVTLPTAFSYSPVVIATADYGVDQDIVVNIQPVSASQFTLRWRKTTGNTASAVDIHWLAIGPE